MRSLAWISGPTHAAHNPTRNAARYFFCSARSNANAIAPPGFGSPRTGARVGSSERHPRDPCSALGFVSSRASPERDLLPGASSRRMVGEMRASVGRRSVPWTRRPGTAARGARRAHQSVYGPDHLVAENRVEGSQRILCGHRQGSQR